MFRTIDRCGVICSKSVLAFISFLQGWVLSFAFRAVLIYSRWVTEIPAFLCPQLSGFLKWIVSGSCPRARKIYGISFGWNLGVKGFYTIRKTHRVFFSKLRNKFLFKSRFRGFSWSVSDFRLHQALSSFNKNPPPWSEVALKFLVSRWSSMLEVPAPWGMVRRDRGIGLGRGIFRS